ncbi:MAPEG family protein [Kangiella japonica]|uniref:MAPEG family protein n=1 Tax=Kangiella japonica TaxID=647384 RepID=A0ABP3CIP4_9GAMM
MAFQPILLPVFVMVILTFSVAVIMARRRFRYYREQRLHPQKTASRQGMTKLMEDNRAADHFMNLFEMPVLFYLAVVIAILTNSASVWLLGLSWLYVACRVVHAYIHCGYNNVFHRFKAFILGYFTLAAIWIVLILDIVLF